MPIVIKEIFASDAISQLMEKVNFNFDQLVLAGGGPMGLQGATGPIGLQGSQGVRGSHWFAGASAIGQTADYDGSDLLTQDEYLDVNGNVFTFVSGTGWTYSGVNIKGATGSDGATGGSYEWRLFIGASGNLASGLNFGPVPPSTLTDNNNLNFIIPIGATKNNLFLGDANWYYSYLTNFNTYPDGVAAGPVYEEDTPKLTIIQRKVLASGVNGIAIGGMGLTGSTSASASALLPGVAYNSSVVNANHFLYVGLGINQNFSTIEGNSYYSHVAQIKNLNQDILIQAGDTLYSKLPSVRILGNKFAVKDYDNDRFILSHRQIAPWVSGLDESIVEINSLSRTGGYTNDSVGFVNLQGRVSNISPTPTGYDHKYCSVIIGATMTNGIALSTNNQALLINRKIESYTGKDSSLYFINTDDANNSTDYIAKMVPVGYGSGANRTLQISTDKLAINPRFGTNSAAYKPLAPLHIAQYDATLPTTIAYAAAPTISSDIGGFMMAADKSNSSTTGFVSRGVALGYIKTSNATGTTLEPLIQAYFSGKVTNAALDPGGILNPALSSKVSPHLYMQIGHENYSGNLGVGLAPTAGNINAYSKVSIGGSIRIGSTSNGYHTVYTENQNFEYGALIEGSILRGSTSIDILQSTDLMSRAGLTATIGASYGILTNHRTISDTFIAGSVGATTAYSEPAFALADLRTGIRLGATGEAYLVNADSVDTIISATTSNDSLRWSSLGDFASTNPVHGVQIKNRFAKKPLYVSNLVLYMNGYSWTPFSTGIAKNYVAIELPTRTSSVVFNLSDTMSILQYSGGSFLGQSNKYLNGVGSPTISLGFDYYLVTLESGEYDGQLVTLIFQEVNSNNEFVIVQDGGFPNSVYGSPVNFDDRIVMAKEQLDVVQDAFWGHKLASKSIDQFKYNPYPFPHGAQSSGATGYDKARSFFYWSPKGQFSAKSYRSITFQWVYSGSGGAGLVSNYRWVEVCREFLNSHKTETY